MYLASIFITIFNAISNLGHDGSKVQGKRIIGTRDAGVFELSP